ncbi:MAG: xanthine dehydrogenase accessory protein XdhC [Pseudomonadota bacterium]
MSLDRAALAAALATHGPVARVVVAEARGSVPRGQGTEMLVWQGGFAGTIGGGALEWQALAWAREVLSGASPRLHRMPLGPALGQCCGGAVTLAIERLEKVPETPWLRRLTGDAPPPPVPFDGVRDGWLYEEAKSSGQALWLWGAGHVGRAIAAVAAPLPGWQLTVVETELGRLPVLPDAVTTLVAADMPRAMAHAPEDAAHLILTHSHEIDLALCHAALTHTFAFCGLIGSATKWARFRTRLAGLGHGPEAIDRITCPIGDPTLGKHPQAIAVGVVAALLSKSTVQRRL